MIEGDFWERNWAVAVALGDPIPPQKGWNETNVPIYCSEVYARAVDRGFNCLCGCTMHLRVQAAMKERIQARQIAAELPVMGLVKPRRNSPVWKAMVEEIKKYHTTEDGE